MRALNRQWRGKNQPTDVLSFAAWEGEEAFVGIDDVLGDLVIAVGVAHKQARAVGHSVEVEVAVLVAHGLLHLLGLDHERSLAEARHQAECEMTFLAGAGYDPTAGLIGRAV
jgi:probable rRNA maturation factor